MTADALLTILRHLIPALQAMHADLLTHPRASRDGGEIADPGLDRQLTIKRVADILESSETYVKGLCYRGELAHHRDEGRWIRIGERQLQDYLDRTRVDAVEAIAS